MPKKLKKLPFLFRPADATAAAWPWSAACVVTPRTLSFRAADVHKEPSSTIITPDSDSPSFSSVSDTAAIAGLTELTSDDRLFFEPGETNSILDAAAKSQEFPYKAGSVAVLALESLDPFLDFRRSMEEMVAAHGMKDWRRLEEMLTCYLRVNGRSNHGYIVGAFVDLLLNLAVDDERSASASSSSTASQISFSSCTDSSDGRRCTVNEGEIKGPN